MRADEGDVTGDSGLCRGDGEDHQRGDQAGDDGDSEEAGTSHGRLLRSEGGSGVVPRPRPARALQ